MAKPSVLVLCNQPVLPKDHPDAESEHTVIEIAENMMKTLREEGYVIRDLRLGDDPTVLWRELTERRPDVVFNLYEGQLDHAETESYVAGLLEWSGMPYTGSPFSTLTLARAKHTTKYLLKGARLPTADFFAVDCLPVPICPLEFPVIVKPAQQDASVGVDQESVCVNQFQLEARVRYILTTYGAPVLVEEFIEGREFNVALVELPDLFALPPSEITFPEANERWSILTYSGKWTPGTPDYEKTPQTFPADLPAATLRKLGRLAQKAYRLLGCRDYGRVDFRMTPEGKPYILEINPNPEISEEAGFAGCLGSAQMTHRDFIIRLVEQALSRRDAPRPTFAPVRKIDAPAAT